MRKNVIPLDWKPVMVPKKSLQMISWLIAVFGEKNIRWRETSTGFAFVDPDDLMVFNLTWNSR